MFLESLSAVVTTWLLSRVTQPCQPLQVIWRSQCCPKSFLSSLSLSCLLHQQVLFQKHLPLESSRRILRSSSQLERSLSGFHAGRLYSSSKAKQFYQLLPSQELLQSTRPSAVLQGLLTTAAFTASLCCKLLHCICTAKHACDYPDHMFALQRVYPCHAWIISIYL